MEPSFMTSELRGIFSNLPVLETDRLILRRITMRDARDVYAYASDP